MASKNPPRFIELPESDATGRIRDIYADIRLCLGAPMVNLVYRHMACQPGCLEWAWGVLRPLFVSGEIAGAAEALVGGVEGAGAFEITGPIDAEAQAALVTVLDAYNRANPMNLIALELLSLALAGDFEPASGREDVASEPPVGEPAPILPSMLDADQVAPETADLMRLLARQSTGGGDDVIPSLYRHLAHWPQCLAVVWGALAVFLAETDLDAAAGWLAGDAGAAAARRSKNAGPPSRPPTRVGPSQ